MAVIFDLVETDTHIVAVVTGGPGNPTPQDAVYLYSDMSTQAIDWFYLNGTKVAPTTPVTSGKVSFVKPVGMGRYRVDFARSTLA